jgi:1-acyl-sn-glycerol-3-phosphate acyltransferase
MTKQYFAILLTFITQYWTPMELSITGDESVVGLFTQENGQLVTKIGDRAILISNHQLYSDWVFLWWIGYTARAHGALFIMLKESLKNIPVFGWGMQGYKFIFLSRKRSKDEKTISTSIQRIAHNKDWPAWILLFPEGTTFSRNGVKGTIKYANKTGKEVPKHLLLPRSTGMRHVLLNLDNTIEYVYDCTVRYDNIPSQVYGEDYFTLRNMYLRGIIPRRAHMHWRRYPVKDIPYQDPEAFEKWIYDRWEEKDALLQKLNTDEGEVLRASAFDPIITPVKLYNQIEIIQIFSVALNVGLIFNLTKQLPRTLGLIRK